MVKHIVMWKLKASALGRTKTENAALVKQKLEALNGRIEGMVKLEVGINYADTDNSADLVLYSEFATRHDLERYQAHPEHKAVMPFVSEVRSERRMVDYEL
jgi:Stress responsive A/B Barrel Domain